MIYELVHCMYNNKSMYEYNVNKNQEITIRCIHFTFTRTASYASLLFIHNKTTNEFRFCINILRVNKLIFYIPH